MKRFFSIAAALAIVGGVAISTPTQATAGTVGVKGDTDVTLYGFIDMTAGWTDKMDSYNAGFTNMPNEKNDDSRYSATDKMVRVGLTFKNKDACVSGRIEYDFANKGNAGDSTRLRRAYINYGYDNFNILAGQEWGVEEVHTFSTNWKAIAGFNGNANRYPQVRFSYNFDLGETDLNFNLALEDKDWTNNTVIKRRFPAIAAKLATKINTGFGKPARVYSFITATPVKIELNSDKNDDKTPVVFGAGFNLPVSMVELQAEYIYSKGATKFAGLTSKTPTSYYVKANGDIEAVKSSAWNIEAKVKPMPKMWLAAGFDYVKFKDTMEYANDPKVETIFANIGYKTTKYTVVSLEWIHAKAKHFYKDDDTVKGNSVFFRYDYKF